VTQVPTRRGSLIPVLFHMGGVEVGGAEVGGVEVGGVEVGIEVGTAGVDGVEVGTAGVGVEEEDPLHDHGSCSPSTPVQICPEGQGTHSYGAEHHQLSSGQQLKSVGTQASAQHCSLPVAIPL